MTTGQLDRIIEIQQRVVARDSFGGEIESWDKLDDVWASVRTTGVQEQYLNESNREQATRNAIMRVLWRSDFGETHRIIYDGRAWDILGIDEVGYRRHLDLTVEAPITGERFGFSNLSIMAGLSDDAIPEAVELTIDHIAGRIEFPAFASKHVLIWRVATEPDIHTVIDEDDPTRENQLVHFDLYPTTVDLDTMAGNVLVSDHLLTFPTPRAMEVA